MERDNYHHGALKQEMVTRGLQLLNKEGYEGLSLRKVAHLCGVSHAAPYKHFKNKEELLLAITQEVVAAFTEALQAVTTQYGESDPLLHLVEMGKAYVRFMVEHPDYLRFLFLRDDWKPITIAGGQFQDGEKPSFQIFKVCALRFLESMKAPTEHRVDDILMMWSLVHGLAVLLVNRSIEYQGDYLELVERMVREKLRFEG